MLAPGQVECCTHARRNFKRLTRELGVLDTGLHSMSRGADLQIPPRAQKTKQGRTEPRAQGRRLTSDISSRAGFRDKRHHEKGISVHTSPRSTTNGTSSTGAQHHRASISSTRLSRHPGRSNPTTLNALLLHMINPLLPP